MTRLENVKKTHVCRKCDKILSPKWESMRVNFYGNNYCVPCGYFEIKEHIDELNIFLNELKSKYGKQIVVERLKR